MALVYWMPLNGDLRNQGYSNATITNNGATVDNNGKIGSCYYFNASSYLYENTYDWTNFNTSQFSLCCWYKQPSPVASGNSQIICIGTNSGWNNIRIGLLRRNSSGYPMFSVSNGSSAVQYNCTATTFSLDTWNHIACTYDNGTIKIYLNGTLDKTYTTTIIPVLNSSQHLGVGAASNGAEKLTGYLNDVRIYDHALSAAEVKEISQGLVLHYKLDDLTNGVLDSSGYGHNGSTLNTVSISSDTPRYSASVNLSATNSMINCGRGGMVTDSITVNFWCKYTTYTTAIISSYQSYGIGFNEHNNSISFTPYITGIGWCRSHEGTNAEQITAASLAGAWHMWTGVYDRINKKVKLYIDSNLKQEEDISTAAEIRYHTSNVLWIGGEATSSSTTGSNATAGLFSDFRIYCTPLDTDAILQLYHTSTKIDNKQNLHTFELIENNSAIKINKRGQTLCNELEEDTATKFFKTNQIIETNEIIEF